MEEAIAALRWLWLFSLGLNRVGACDPRQNKCLAASPPAPFCREPLPQQACSRCSSTNCPIHDEQTGLPGPPAIMQRLASNFRTRGKGLLCPHAGSADLLLGRKECCLMTNPFWISLPWEAPVWIHSGGESQRWTADDVICTDK